MARQPKSQAKPSVFHQSRTLTLPARLAYPRLLTHVNTVNTRKYLHCRNPARPNHFANDSNKIFQGQSGPPQFSYLLLLANGDLFDTEHTGDTTSILKRFFVSKSSKTGACRRSGSTFLEILVMQALCWCPVRMPICYFTQHALKKPRRHIQLSTVAGPSASPLIALQEEAKYFATHLRSETCLCL